MATGARPARSDLASRVKDPGFTPGARDLEPLVAMLAGDDADAAERALVRGGDSALAPLLSAASAGEPALRARAARALGRFPHAPRVREALLAALGDREERVRRSAAGALGRVRGEGVEDALLAALASEEGPSARRAMAEALGKVGSARAIEPLARASAGQDPELERVARKAAARVERTELRAHHRGGIDRDRAPAEPLDVEVRCRPGLEPFLEEELSPRFRVLGKGAGFVRIALAQPLRALLEVRTFTSLAFPLAVSSARGREAIDPGAIARVIGSPEATRVLATFSDPPWRYRIAWRGGGHKRGLVFQVAEAVRAQDPRRVNDPVASTWAFEIAPTSARGDALVPTGLEDDRFAYRVGDVPAASHPTIAAALARVAGVRADDVVWDPFVGSGTELVERGRLGPHGPLLGSDLDPRALEVAATNLRAAGVEATLSCADATIQAPPGVTLILTNPPMGRRVARDASIGPLLDRFVAHAAHVLVRGGRLVWLSPFGERTARAARAAGLRLDFTRTVDMGGFPADLQRLIKESP